MLQRSPKSEMTYECKYPCVICFERVKYPVSCLQCKHILCGNHLRKINNRCPYCRLTPFTYKEEKGLQGLVQLDKKKEEDFLIANKVFKCLAEKCNFEGKYHKMDLHRRRQHRNLTLREVLFEQDCQRGKRLRAMELLIKRIKQKKQKQVKAYNIAKLLHTKNPQKIEFKKLEQMVLHAELCQYKDCERVFFEQTMCFIGKADKQLSTCPEAQGLITFF